MSLLEEKKLRHPNDEQIEQYSLGLLDPETVSTFEQHVLICSSCQDRVAKMDAFVQGMQAEARRIRVKAMQRRDKTSGVNRF